MTTLSLLGLIGCLSYYRSEAFTYRHCHHHRVRSPSSGSGPRVIKYQDCELGIYRLTVKRTWWRRRDGWWKLRVLLSPVPRPCSVAQVYDTGASGSGCAKSTKRGVVWRRRGWLTLMMMQLDQFFFSQVPRIVCSFRTPESGGPSLLGDTQGGRSRVCYRIGRTHARAWAAVVVQWHPNVPVPKSTS
jgi:hypothetical protein